MDAMTQRIDCVCVRLQHWAGQQLAKAGGLLRTRSPCDASKQAGRQTGGRMIGLLDYCTLSLVWHGHTRADARHAAGS